MGRNRIARSRVSHRVAAVAFGALCAALASPVAADQGSGDDADLSPAELSYLESASLEDLGAIPIYSASKKEERRFESAGAVFVISQQDIRRSAVTSIPEFLRMVPGLQVARGNGNRWIVTARDFASVSSRH